MCPSGFVSFGEPPCFVLLRKIFDVPNPTMNRPGPGGLLHDAGVHRDLDRVAGVGRDDPPADRQLLGVAGHQGRDDRRGARLHPVLAPPRVGLGEPDRVEAAAVERPRRLEHLAERLHRELHHPDPERRRHGGYCCGGAATLAARLAGRRGRHLLVERREHLVHLLLDDRLQHALAHRADRPGDRDVGGPEHLASRRRAARA